MGLAPLRAALAGFAAWAGLSTLVGAHALVLELVRQGYLEAGLRNNALAEATRLLTPGLRGPALVALLAALATLALRFAPPEEALRRHALAGAVVIQALLGVTALQLAGRGVDARLLGLAAGLGLALTGAWLARALVGPRAGAPAVAALAGLGVVALLGLRAAGAGPLVLSALELGPIRTQAAAWTVGGLGAAWVLLVARAGPAGRVALALLALAPAALPLLPRPAARGPNVLVIALDTVRPDRMNLDGAGPRDVSPNLRALAARGVRYDAAWSPSPWTMPAFASVLTGRYPAEHGAISLQGWLPARALTLAEVMREAGWSTAAVVSHIYVDEHHGFRQGVDHFDAALADGAHDRVTGAAVTDRALAWLDARPAGPFQLTVHYFDPHYEYLDHPAPPWSDGYQGWLREVATDIQALRHKRHLLGEAERQHLLDLFDEELAYTDAQLGRLLDGLEERGLAGDTVVVVVGDHGEEFLERGWLGHTITLNQEVTRVPLIVVRPGGPVGVEPGPVETRRVFGEVLAAAGLEGPPGLAAGEGVAFSMVWLDDAPVDSGKTTRMAAVRTAERSLIRDLAHRREALYDLVSDPEERVPLDPGLDPDLGAALDAWLSGQAVEAGPARALSDEEIERLKALGYL